MYQNERSFMSWSVYPVYTGKPNEFRTVPKFVRFFLFTRKTNSAKICKVLPVYTADEFGQNL